AKEQHKPLPLARRSNHGLSGEFANRPSSRAASWTGISIVVSQNVKTARPMGLHIVASVKTCRVSDSKRAMCHSRHPSIGGHLAAFLVRTVRLCKPRAAGIELQRQSLVLPAIAEQSLAGPHTVLSGARSGHPEIPTHRDAPRPCLC